MVWTAVLGWALAALYLRSKRSLAPVIVSHFLIDAIIEQGLLLWAVSRH
jgi:membrane protease YdiL (CAAX protease family)